jgi:hypothetical protein
VRASDFKLVARTELLRSNLLRPPPHPARDVAALEAQLLAAAVDAANDDVGMRVPRVVVVHGCPLDLLPQVLLDARHQPPHVRSQIQLTRVLGREDESKLVLLPEARLFERLAPHRTVRPIELALGAVLLDPVALDVPKVKGCGLGAVRRQPNHARLDDDATRVGPMGAGAKRAR